ncbi:hypothetical protein Dsin_029459 [Dipteronia sinensis]|uniref:Uncharacterized protein n=1 Tax=Dipteronia sinensis TaxID=43782 RepID=A0AAD9ZSE0_9ROSI|nr:hypothetical protein Dsin_029459 [Dipteronia sinensis]
MLCFLSRFLCSISGSWFHQPSSGSLFTSSLLGLLCLMVCFVAEMLMRTLKLTPLMMMMIQNRMCLEIFVSLIFEDGFDNSCGCMLTKICTRLLYSENYKASESLVDISTGNSAMSEQKQIGSFNFELGFEYTHVGLVRISMEFSVFSRSLRSGDRNLSDGSESNSPSMGSSNSPYVGIDNEFGDMILQTWRTGLMKLIHFRHGIGFLDPRGWALWKCVVADSFDIHLIYSMVLTCRTEFMASFSRKVEAYFRQQDHIDVFFENIYAGFYDTALGLVQHDPELAVTRYVNDETALHGLARKPSAYASRSRGFLRKVFNFYLVLLN